MLSRWRALLTVPVAALLVCPLALRADEDSLQFLQALRSAGYSDTALIFLENLEKSGKLPPSLQETLDLEKSQTYRAASKNAYDSKQAKLYQGKAKEHLDNFIKNHPGHPAVANAALADADAQLENALLKLIVAKNAATAEAKTPLTAEARKSLEACLTLFVKVRDRFKQTFDSLPKPVAPVRSRKPSPAEAKLLADREQAEEGYVESRLKEGLIAYQIAHTIDDAKSAERKKFLDGAIVIFRAIHGKYGLEAEVGLQAKLWEGRSLEALNDRETARDVYEELLVMEPAKSANESDVAFFSQAALIRLKLIIAMDKGDLALTNVADWIESHKHWNKTDGYQGMAIEYAKLLMNQAAKAPVGERGKLAQQINKILNEITKVDSDYKSEAILLRLKNTKSEGKAAGNFDEALTLGENAYEAGDWDGAKQAFAQAITFAETAKNVANLAVAKKSLNRALYQIALVAYEEKKYPEALRQGLAIMQAGRDDPLASTGGALALYAANSLYQADKNDANAKSELERIAKLIIEQWPTKADADEARVILGQFHNERGEQNEAFKYFDQVSPESRRYPTAQLITGQMFWKKYVEEKKLPVEEANAERKLMLREKAVERFKNAVAALKSVAAADPDKPPTQQHLDARLILAQAQLEAGRPAEAVSAVEPVVESLQKNKPQAVDQSVLRVMVIAIKAQLAVENTDKAGEIAAFMLELGADAPEVNAVLIDFARLIGNEVRIAKTAMTEANAKNDSQAARDAGQRHLQASKLQSDFITKLLLRENYNVAGKIYLADACAVLDRTSEARGLYKEILDQAKTDKEFRAANEKALTRIRSKEIELLRDEEKYEEALKQVEQLIAANPKNLEPLLTKARILQAWAKTDPKRYDESVGEWTKIRLLLNRKNPKPPEYYEAIYSAAESLLLQAAAQKDPSKAALAEQLLTGTLTNMPNLDGAENVAKFKLLLKKANAAAQHKK